MGACLSARAICATSLPVGWPPRRRPARTPRRAGTASPTLWASTIHAAPCPPSNGACSAHRKGETIGQATDADILITNDPQVATAIQTADCVPVLIADTATGAVAAAHAGWRGMAQRVPQATVEAMLNAFGTRPSQLVAAIGPSIGACCYEVGGDVRDRFAAAGFNDRDMSRWFSREVRPTPTNPSMAGLGPRPRGTLGARPVGSRRDQLRAAGAATIGSCR